MATAIPSTRRGRTGSPVLDILLSRLAQLVVVLVGVSFLTFFMLNLLPGDPAVATLGDDATPEALASFRAEHDLDRPVLTRYLTWAGGAVTGDLGQSYRNDRDVLDTIVDRVPVSLELVVIAQVISLALAIPAALLAVWKRNTIVDRALSMSAFAGLSIPSFLLAFLLILVFAVQLNWLPASGFTRISEGFGDNLRTALLPALTLSLSQYSVYMRLLRSEMIETLGNEYITTVGVRRILVRHVMRNSLFSMITVIGVNIGVLLGGAVITESIFAIPGIGRLLIDSISQRDLMMVQGVVLFVAVTYVVINLLVDLSYTLLDPRIRHGSRAE